MSFIKDIAGPDEEVIGVASVHWIYVVKGLVWLLSFMGMGLLGDDLMGGLVDYGITAYGLWGNFIFWILTVVGIVISFFYFLMWIAAEIGLTTKRLIYKSGLIFVDVVEVDLEEIKSAEIDSGFLGVFLGYGYVFLDARFMRNVMLPAVSDAYGFVQALNAARSKLKSDSLNIVLEEPSGDNVKVHKKGSKKAKKPLSERLKAGPRKKETKNSSDPVETSPSKHIEEGDEEGLEKNTQQQETLVFPLDVETRKQRMRRMIKKAFWRKSHQTRGSAANSS